MDLVQKFDDGKRLVELSAVVRHKSRNEPLRIDACILGLAMGTLWQMHVRGLIWQSFQVERDPHPKCSRAAKVGIKLQSAGAIFTLSSPTPSMPACNSSPGL